MESLREFLETSTIHGLSYISTAPTKPSKGFWLLVVIIGFSTAFYLINSSYDDWQASPIATSITTHPISELYFPTVTVCPPVGSNTALNYDLARVRNVILTEKDRDDLANVTTYFLVDKPSQDFVHLARSLLNEQNILEMFEKKPTISYPMAYNSEDNTPGFEVWSSKLSGSYRTPSFGKKWQGNYTLPNVHFALELPMVVMKKVFNDVLSIQIETASNDDWYVQYREGVKYSVHTKEMSWQDAENFCVDKGGHLASVKNVVDKDELRTGSFELVCFCTFFLCTFHRHFFQESLGRWVG